MRVLLKNPKFIIILLLIVILSACNQKDDTADYSVDYSFHEQVEKISEKLIDGVSYDIVTFGDYPQTIKNENVSVRKTAYMSMGGNAYYPGSDGNLYAELNGEYFKVEPVKWRVLTKDYENTENALLLAEDIITGGVEFGVKEIPYYFSLVSVPSYSFPSNLFTFSYLRCFLNSIGFIESYIASDGMYRPEINTPFTGTGLINKVFSKTSRFLIKEIQPKQSMKELYDSDTGEYSGYGRGTLNSKLFVLSLTESANPDYGFPPYDYYLDNTDSSKDDGTRIKRPTDYAVALGVQRPEEEKYGNPWWLRSGDFLLGDQVRCVDYDGYGYALYSAYDTSVGIVPALVVDYK